MIPQIKTVAIRLLFREDRSKDRTSRKGFFRKNNFKVQFEFCFSSATQSAQQIFQVQLLVWICSFCTVSCSPFSLLACHELAGGHLDPQWKAQYPQSPKYNQQTHNNAVNSRRETGACIASYFSHLKQSLSASFSLHPIKSLNRSSRIIFSSRWGSHSKPANWIQDGTSK